MHWRKLNILTHRYLSYYFFGLTVVYSISGFAVNHIHDWNSNYIINRKEVAISPLKDTEEISKQELDKIISDLQINVSYKDDNIFYPSEDKIEVIFDESEKLIINTTDKTAQHEHITKRPILHAFNFLHLNEPKKFWTYYSDFYAVSLLVLAITGMFMKKGKEGIWGKGGILAVLGLVIPIIALLLYY